MVFVSVWTTGTSFVEISSVSPPVGTLLKLIVSVFTTGDCVNKTEGIGTFSKAYGFLRTIFFLLGEKKEQLKSALHLTKKKGENSLHYSGTFMYVMLATFSTTLDFRKKKSKMF